MLPARCTPDRASGAGELLAFSDDRAVFLAVVAEGSLAVEPCLVAEGGAGDVVWSGDGLALAIHSYDDEWAFYNTRTAEVEQLPPGIPSEVQVVPASEGFLIGSERTVWSVSFAPTMETTEIAALPAPPENIVGPAVVSLQGVDPSDRPLLIARHAGGSAYGTTQTEMYVLESDTETRPIGPNADESGSIQAIVAVDHSGETVALISGWTCGSSCAASSRLDLLDMSTGDPIARPEPASVPEHWVLLHNSVTFGGDGTIIVGASLYPDGSEGHPFFDGANGGQELYRVEGDRLIPMGVDGRRGETSADGQLAYQGTFEMTSGDDSLYVTTNVEESPTKVWDGVRGWDWAPSASSAGS